MDDSLLDEDKPKVNKVEIDYEVFFETTSEEDENDEGF